jgi:hypothetical protein
MAPTAPTPAASVGEATPAMIEPRTAVIKNSGGSSARPTCRTITPRVKCASSALGMGGAISGRRMATITMKTMKINTRISPGMMAPMKRSPTGTPMMSPISTRTMLGGMIWPRVPEAATVPVASSLE